jgi:hypothetical protein
MMEINVLPIHATRQPIRAHTHQPRIVAPVTATAAMAMPAPSINATHIPAHARIRQKAVMTTIPAPQIPAIRQKAASIRQSRIVAPVTVTAAMAMPAPLINATHIPAHARIRQKAVMTTIPAPRTPAIPQEAASTRQNRVAGGGDTNTQSLVKCNC